MENVHPVIGEILRSHGMEPIEAERYLFMNRLRSLFNIDRDRLPELSETEWPRFRDNPVRYFLHANPVHYAAIWREIEARQRK